MERFTISLDETLAREFDELIRARGYDNRSEAVRDILREKLEQHRLAREQAPYCIAALSYIYNHHERDLAERLMTLKHEHHDLTLSSMHAHLDHEHCIETVLLRGRVASVQRFADQVCAERGVHHGKLNLISVELHLPHRHDHGPGSERHVHLKPSS